ncbi:MmgE/PrpD family protein [Rhodopila sp.]|uniref:MmgE/PrpD family protein n=1 Tax=Rhodopila sp. TaxID=2480087 RepID=UPI002C0E999C|nr:MmgE/PrpD family protein [Rhodopila sp.]HVZ08000.1 MmgE/PrpD family protein [Rhodopila sp.]
MTDQPDPAAALAAHVASTRFQDLPDATVEATKRDLMDTLGCALGGSGAPGIAALLKLFRRWGGAGESGLLLVDGRLPAPQAAFIHGAMAHALDYDDTYDRGGSIHPGASVLGAALATAEIVANVTGRDLILAAALGLDVSCRIALAATVDRGWHRTSAIGVFGATAVAGKLLGLSAGQMHHALGIALSSAAGSRQCIVDGALTKRFQAGQAASAGIVAALLAADGFTGAVDVFTGRFGFYPLYQPGPNDLDMLTAELGRVWRGDDVSFKPYPCGRPLHAAIDGAIALHQALGLDDGGTLDSVTVTAAPSVVAEYFLGAPHKRAPTQIVEAQFALPYLLAAGLLYGRVGIDQVAQFSDPRVLELAQRIQGVSEDGPPGITARRGDGRSASRMFGIPLGAPENPLSEAQRVEKFRDCAAHAVRPIKATTVDRLLELLNGLETVPDGKAVAALLA